jgi:hypothetical protein
MPKIRLDLLPDPKKQTLATVPSNYGYAGHAFEEIKRTVAMANNRYEEALKVNPIPVMLWRRTQEGFRCTCRSDNDFVAEEINDNPTDETQVRDEPTPRSDSGIIRVRSSRALANQDRETKEIVLGVDIGQDGTYETREDIHKDDGPGPSFLDDPNAMQHFLQSGTNTTTCGICIGTGFTNGYSLYGGQRIVFDSHTLKTNTDFSIKDEDNAPLTYVGVEGAILTWTFRVPMFFKAAWITARANIKSADVQILINGAPLPLKGLSAFKGQTVTLSVVALNDDAEFTHVEAVLQFKEWPNTQADNIQDDTNYTSVEPTQTLDFPFSPSVQRVNRGDLFFDFKYGKMWRVNSVVDYKLTDGTAISWQASATSRTRFDILSLLKTPLFPDYEISFDDIQFG